MTKHRLHFEQHWPWEILYEEEHDLTAMSGKDADPQLEFLYKLGYVPQISVEETVVEEYTTVNLIFWVEDADLTAFLLKYPFSANSLIV